MVVADIQDDLGATVVQSIVADGSRALVRLPIFEAAEAVDADRYRAGLPHVLDLV